MEKRIIHNHFSNFNSVLNRNKMVYQLDKSIGKRELCDKENKKSTVRVESK